jgi:hypothetical protein
LDITLWVIYLWVIIFTKIEAWLRREAMRRRESQPLAAVGLVQAACFDATDFPAWSSRDSIYYRKFYHQILHARIFYLKIIDGTHGFHTHWCRF